MIKNKKILYIILILLVILLLFFFFIGKKPKVENTIEENIITETTTSSDIVTTVEKIIPNDTLCNQITKEFVSKATGVAIARVNTINDASITACNFYLTDEGNSPYIAVILNKNLSIEVQKTFYAKQKLDLLTDPRIITDHFIYKSVKEDRIAHIDIVLDPMNFIRIDKNVDRAVDNEGLTLLAIEISKRL